MSYIFNLKRDTFYIELGTLSRLGWKVSVIFVILRLESVCYFRTKSNFFENNSDPISCIFQKAMFLLDVFER